MTAALRAPEAWDTAPRTGIPALREALAAHLAAPVDRLAVTSGIRGQVPALLAGVDAVVVERPTFLSVPRLAAQHGVRVELRDWEDILGGERLPGRCLIWVTSPARNPDGRTLTPAEARRLDELAEDHRVVVNQAYHWCAPDAPQPVRAELVGSLHKVSGGGCAVGWRVSPGGVGPDRPAAGGPPTAWQLAWASMIGRGGVAAPVRTGLLDPSARAAAFTARPGLPDGVRVRHGAGPSLLLLVPDHVTEDELSTELARQGLSVGLGSAFGQERGAVRLSFTGVSDEDVPACVEGVHKTLARLGLS
ncbi:aminotransferase class I/II-fold pyridoxal phosphate-dependent enzyme [Streptomyces sp. MBT62]|uniref:aminotransferase class I/II-fold pyridoxal phosphate-dependent enzyme n=1 Tax=Streptomyces sp. MBT62 TaxID=2800410 RepID=UPI00190C4FBE|nr:aminotransferase class I/II-fold pyridoxal phosphate-dependent enzyme [Streptomyces sp. MBT62]MBK3571233.1 aminotransferase class I/II-fold pyridoxal phosphate-dependent enzyme [Streptomyces sp. MBT62]